VEKYNKDLVALEKLALVQISADNDVKAASNWAKKESLPWPTVLSSDSQTEFLKTVKTNAVPTYVLVDKSGKEILRGHTSEPIITKAKELLKPTP